MPTHLRPDRRCEYPLFSPAALHSWASLNSVLASDGAICLPAVLASTRIHCLGLGVLTARLLRPDGRGEPTAIASWPLLSGVPAALVTAELRITRN